MESSKLSNYLADMCWSSPCTMVSCLHVLKIGFLDQHRVSFASDFSKTFCSPLVYLCHWPKCEHIEGSTDFSFQTQILQFVWISSNKIHPKINIFHTLALKNCEINSTKSDSLRAFQQHQECPQIPIQFSVSILFSFHWKNGSMINSFHSVVYPKEANDYIIYIRGSAWILQ